MSELKTTASVVSLPPLEPRCSWALAHPLLREYHDREWGIPSYEDRYLFELLCLEGAQAGLSWLTILKKRAAYKKAFLNFDICRCGELTDAELEEILLNPGIVRNRLKVYAVRKNARVVLKIQQEYGSLADYLWGFTGGKQVVHQWALEAQVPAQDTLSERVSRDLRKRGASFAGPVVIYSFLQAVGIIDDHVAWCVCKGKKQPVQENTKTRSCSKNA